MKKVMSVIIALIMIITMLPTMAFAETQSSESLEQENCARLFYSTGITSIVEISGVEYENDTDKEVITAQEGQITIKIKNELGIGILRAVNVYSREVSDTSESRIFDRCEGSFEVDSSGIATLVFSVDKNREYALDDFSFYEWPCMLYSKNITLSDITGAEYENNTERCILAAKKAGDISFKVKSTIEERKLKSISVKSAALTGKLDNLEYTTDEGTFNADTEGTVNLALTLEKNKTYILVIEFEDSINSVAGSIERVSSVGGADCKAIVAGDTITFSGTIDYAPAYGNPAGNHVGVLIRKPNNFTFDSDVKVTMNGIEHLWKKSYGNTFGLFPNLLYPGQSVKIKVDWTEKDSQTFIVKAADDITLVPGPVAQLEKEDGTKGETYNSLQDAIDNAEENDTVRIITDHIVLNKPIVINNKSINIYGCGTHILTGADFTGDCLFEVKDSGIVRFGELISDGKQELKYAVKATKPEAGSAAIRFESCGLKNFSEAAIEATNVRVYLAFVDIDGTSGKCGVRISETREVSDAAIYIRESEITGTNPLVYGEKFKVYKPVSYDTWWWDTIISDIIPWHTTGYNSWKKGADGIYTETIENSFSIEKVNSVGGANCSATVDGSAITFSGTIDYVPKDNNPAGNRVGILIKKLSDLTFDSPAKVTMNGIEYEWTKDDGDSFGLFPTIAYPGQSIDIIVEWGDGNSQTFTVKAADDVILVPGPVAQLEKEDGTKGETYNSLQDAIDAAGDDDIIRIIEDYIVLDKPLIIDGKTVQLWQNYGVFVQAADNFAGDSMLVVKNKGLLEGRELHLDGNNKVKYGIQTLPGDYRCAIDMDNCSFKNFTEYAVVVDGADATLKYFGTDGSNRNGAVHLISGSNPGNVTQCWFIGCEFKETKDIVYDENFNRYKLADEEGMIIADFEPEHTDGYNKWEKGTDGIYTEKKEGSTPVGPVGPVGPVAPVTPVTPEDNVTNADKSTTADLTPAVSDNKANTTVDADTAAKIVDKALANKSSEVIVDATGNNTVASSDVAIPETTVKELSEKTDANLVIKTDNGKVDLDKTALDAVAAQAGTTGTVKLIVETVKTDENACHVNLKLMTSNGNVTDFKGGNVKITVSLDKELAGKELVCVYINNNGSYTKVDGVLNADGTYTFTTGHFSEYAVMPKDEADKTIAEQLDALIKEVNLKATTVKTAKKNVKVTVNGDVTALKDAGYTVKYKFYRSTKKASKYTAKVTKDTNTYINTTGKKGTRYYYKAKMLVYDGDTLVGSSALKQCKYGSRIWTK